jgi:hypothetical protein
MLIYANVKNLLLAPMVLEIQKFSCATTALIVSEYKWYWNSNSKLITIATGTSKLMTLQSEKE